MSINFSEMPAPLRALAVLAKTLITVTRQAAFENHLDTVSEHAIRSIVLAQDAFVRQGHEAAWILRHPADSEAIEAAIKHLNNAQKGLQRILNEAHLDEKLRKSAPGRYAEVAELLNAIASNREVDPRITDHAQQLLNAAQNVQGRHQPGVRSAWTAQQSRPPFTVWGGPPDTSSRGR